MAKWFFVLLTVVLTLPVMAAENSIKGAVYDTSGNPVAGVAIRLDGAVNESTISGPDGAFLFQSIPDGRYTLTLGKQDLATRVIRNLIIPSQSSLVAKITMHPSLTTLRVIGSAVARERLPFNTTPAAVKVFPREAYRDQGQAALETILNQTPGAAVALPSQQNQAQPLAPYAATVRSGLPWETAALIDGNSVSLPSTGTFNLAYVPSFLLQEVEIIKGFGNMETTIGDALDGAINLRTADPTAVRKGTIEIEADSHGGQFSDLAYAGTAPGGRFSYSTMFAIDGNPGPVPSMAAAGAGLQRAQLLKAKYQFSSSITAVLTFAGTQGALGDAVARGFSLPGGAFGSFANSGQAQESHRFGLYSFELQDEAGNDHVTAKAYAMQLQRTNTYDAFAFPQIGSGVNSQDNVLGFSLQDDHQIADNLYQLQVSDREGRSQAAFCGDTCATLIPGGARSGETMVRLSMMAHPTKAFDLQFSAAALQLREHYSSNAGMTYTDRSILAPVFHAGAALHVLPDLTVRFAAGTGVADVPEAVLNSDTGFPLKQTPVGLPSLIVTQTAAPNLNPENAFGFDAGAEYRLHGDTTTLSFDLYDLRIHGTYFDQMSPGTTPNYIWTNGPAMTHQGIEIGLQQFKRVGLGFITQFSLLRNYVDGTIGNVSGGGNLAVLPWQNLTGGSPLVPGANDIAQLRVPYAQGYGEISYKWPRGSRLSLGALFLGANNPYARPAFVQLNSNLELSLGAWSKLQITVQNLSNIYPDGLPVGYAGIGVPLQTGAVAPVNAGVIGPRTIRLMFRQSIGGSIFEH